MHARSGIARRRWAVVAGALLATSASAHGPAQVGRLGPLIPWHKDAIHISVVWPKTRPPQLCFWMRPAEWRGTDLVNPVQPMGELRLEFQSLVYGGFRFSRTLEESVRTRILDDLSLENTLCADIPHAFANTGKYNIADLTEADFALNAWAFHDAGHSRGLSYNLFCAGNVMLADGRLAVIGGHDKAGNHGIRKINIYDPETGRWLPRPEPPVMTDYLADPTGTQFPHRSALDETNTDVPDPADMHYQRWYPTAVTLPDGKVLILSGTDQDSSVGPGGAPFTKVRIETPEVYDPATDRSIALENARKLQPMYVRSFVVQTGRGWNDWKVLTLGEAVPPFPTGEELGSYDPWEYDGKTYLLDVQAALADPSRNTPGTRHWELIATAASAHESGAAVQLVHLDGRGMPHLQKVIAFGGSGFDGATALVESLELRPTCNGITTRGWKREALLPFPLTQNNAAVLPDGNVLVVGGAERGATGFIANFDVQLYHPPSGRLTTVARMNVPRHDHSNVTLLPDASVLISGGNRVDLTPEDPNVAVPVAQIYQPAYLFRGARPEVLSAPRSIEYGGRFTMKVRGKISQVSLLRIGPTTHNWAWGNSYVRLAFDQRGNRLVVAAPAVPGAAVPGLYMLFVVDKHGVPSVAHRIHLGGT